MQGCRNLTFILHSGQESIPEASELRFTDKEFNPGRYVNLNRSSPTPLTAATFGTQTQTEDFRSKFRCALDHSSIDRQRCKPYFLLGSR